MKYEIKRVIAVTIKEQMKGKELSESDWKEIKEAYENELKPHMRVVANGFDRTYVVGSPLLSATINAFMNEGQEFQVMRVEQ